MKNRNYPVTSPIHKEDQIFRRASCKVHEIVVSYYDAETEDSNGEVVSIPLSACCRVCHQLFDAREFGFTPGRELA